MLGQFKVCVFGIFYLLSVRQNNIQLYWECSTTQTLRVEAYWRKYAGPRHDSHRDRSLLNVCMQWRYWDASSLEKWRQSMLSLSLPTRTTFIPTYSECFQVVWFVHVRAGAHYGYIYMAQWPIRCKKRDNTDKKNRIKAALSCLSLLWTTADNILVLLPKSAN